MGGPDHRPRSGSGERDFCRPKSFSSERLREVLAEQLRDIASSGSRPRMPTMPLVSWLVLPEAGISSGGSDIRDSRVAACAECEGRAASRRPSLRFEGSRAFPDKTLYEYFAGVTPERLAEAKLPYNESEVREGARRVRDFYASEGFLDATTDTAGTRVRPTGSMRLGCADRRGDEVPARRITFTGHPVFERKELIEALALKPRRSSRRSP